MKKLLIMLPLVAAACSSNDQRSLESKSDFWGRTDASSALYMRGPKAQHQLHKDIASCVSEVKELSRLGTIRDANPPAGIEMNVNLADKWQSPQGDGPLHTEFQDFNDFESCMNYKGWKRINYLGDRHIDKARSNYSTTILGKTASETNTYNENAGYTKPSATGDYNE